MKAPRAPQEEPHRLYAAIAEAISKNNRGVVKVFGSYLEVAQGEGVPQEITDSHRLNTTVVEVISKGVSPVKTFGTYVEIINGGLINPPTHVFCTYAEVAQGEGVPQEITDSHRMNATVAEVLVKRTKPHIKAFASYIEVVTTPNPYSPVTNVQFIY